MDVGTFDPGLRAGRAGSSGFRVEHRVWSLKRLVKFSVHGLSQGLAC